MNNLLPLTPEHVFYIIKSNMPTPAGLYSQYFTRSERALLDLFPAEDGLSELNLLRVLSARMLATARRKPGRDLTRQVALLSTLSHTAANIAALARLRAKSLTLAEDPLLQALAALDVDDL